MPSGDNALDFATISDIFLAHGSLQSPAFFDGYLCARLALEDISAEDWLGLICAALGVEEPATREDGEQLLAWRVLAKERLDAQEMSFEPLLPDELFSLAERAQSLALWCQGFHEVAGEVDHEQRKTWSTPLQEGVADIEQLSQIDADIEESSENENDLFALTEHARMTALMLYVEQHPGQPDVEKPAQSFEEGMNEAGLNDEGNGATRH
ncbi:hypothetical protein GCM10010082_15940 [Kushneria pakistanensis]|uniref:Uncharacterized protein n=1 Tax=Kushneria pakistanensis TaxID=1508770 RepID=A0ABQ3FHA7_9GAMM|nr:UPF0149 family protein [Kushneria pakistanensis]GHC24235.1 hypothetical protein GCM10010082_15940 [Kushneria pakistanensis]